MSEKRCEKHAGIVDGQHVWDGETNAPCAACESLRRASDTAPACPLCADAYDAGYIRGLEMGRREGFVEGQASVEEADNKCPDPSCRAPCNACWERDRRTSETQNVAASGGTDDSSKPHTAPDTIPRPAEAQPEDDERARSWMSGFDAMYWIARDCVSGTDQFEWQDGVKDCLEARWRTIKEKERGALPS